MKRIIPDRFKAAFEWLQNAPIEDVYAAVDQFPFETDFDSEFQRRTTLDPYSFARPEGMNCLGADLSNLLMRPPASSFFHQAYFRWISRIELEFEDRAPGTGDPTISDTQYDMAA